MLFSALEYKCFFSVMNLLRKTIPSKLTKSLLKIFQTKPYTTNFLCFYVVLFCFKRWLFFMECSLNSY